MLHELKINVEFFKHVKSLEKTFEVRINDRNFNVGDYIILKEYNPKSDSFTGETFKGIITYITDYGQLNNYIVFSFKKIE